MINVQRLRAVAAETLEIVAAGGYDDPSGARVDISEQIGAAVTGTRLHPPTEELCPVGSRNPSPVIEVINATTLEAGARLAPDAAALVFASARRPGGGFRSGAVAQEEDIARASALHACLSSVPEFYQHHRAEADLRYSDRVIYSPGVPVFRDDTTWRLLRVPYQLAMLTAAAPNLRAVEANQPAAARTVPETIRGRARRVLEVAAAHGHRRLVLGAWGCGVFGNDPAVVADAFAEALRRWDRFDHVVFAVLDRAAGAPTYRAFVDAYAGPG